jgi:hypothetical protein
MTCAIHRRVIVHAAIFNFLIPCVICLQRNVVQDKACDDPLINPGKVVLDFDLG